jgi:hypothetical protein
MSQYDCSREPRMSDVTSTSPAHDHDIHHSLHLTDREMAIAKIAAKLAVKEVSDEFYRQVGKSVVTRMLIWIGLFMVGFGAAKGWIIFKP